jgi:5-carboxymethyl-2-hydroxymuconate isomerase
MPHFIAECTDNIREQADLPGLFAKVNEALAATGIFPLGGIRSRATGWTPGRWPTASTITPLCI